jgi:hypothetical protein
MNILRSADELLAMPKDAEIDERLHDIDALYTDWYQRVGWQVV